MTDPIMSRDFSAECCSGSRFCSLNPASPPANVSSMTTMATHMAVILTIPEPGTVGHSKDEYGVPRVDTDQWLTGLQPRHGSMAFSRAAL